MSVNREFFPETFSLLRNTENGKQLKSTIKQRQRQNLYDYSKRCLDETEAENG